MRSPVLLPILMVATISACGQPLTPEMSGSGGTGSGEIGTGGSGSCGTICGSGSTCSNSSCECSVAGQQLCGASCIDVSSDSRNCGGCGQACAASEICSNGSCADPPLLGCPMSDPPATSEIATFSSDGGIAPLFELFTFGFSPQPTYTISAGVVNIVDTIETSATNQYQGFGIYLNGNAAGTDCVDASRYTGISFSLSGSVRGAGCAMQFSIDDSEHIPSATSLDPKAAGPMGSYAPQLSITSSELTSTATTIMVPFAGIGAPAGGIPPTPIDPSKLVSVQWWMSTPVITSNGGATECVWNVNLSNVSFYK